MPWTFIQSTGQLYHNGALVGLGYSGAGHSLVTGRNNPAMESVGDHGPIPAGTWTIGNSNSHGGRFKPPVMSLEPLDHAAHGRRGFLIHGDNKKGDASHGCVIVNHSIRLLILHSGDTVLHVQSYPDGHGATLP